MSPIQNYRQRNSGIELLKVIAIFLVILCHTSQILFEGSNHLLSVSAPLSFSTFFIAIFKYMGSLGNIIFMICSFYYLLGKNAINKQRVIKIIINNFIISFVFLVFYILIGKKIPLLELISNLFPTYFCKNWFISCYILIYLLHPLFNIIINSIDERTLKIYVSVSLLIYCGICNFISSLYLNDLIIFVVIYFLLGYLKKCNKLSTNKNKNMVISLVSFVSLVLLVMFTNILGSKIDLLKNEIFHWNDIKNPLIILLGISIFNIFNSLNISNEFINRISSYSLLIYVIHSNSLYTLYSKENLVLWFASKINNNVMCVLIYSALSFVVCSFISFIYLLLFEKTINVIADKISDRFEKIIEKI